LDFKEKKMQARDIEAICVLHSEKGEAQGIVSFHQNTTKKGTQIQVFMEGLTPGLHGFHVHRSGNVLEGAGSLCDHYNPFGKAHGGRNDPNAHLGDLGNVYANERGEVDETFYAKYIDLYGPYSILGRSIVVHSDPDDLGKGPYKDSKTTGHSGKRILWGIIGIKEECN
jgi:Cu-Zn family superoxide dismutase